MKHLLLAPLLGAPLLSPAPAVELAFTPAEGDTLTTTCERVTELELVSSESSLLVDGESRGDPEEVDIGMALRQTESITFTDEFVEVGEDRVLELRRTFDEIGGTAIQSLTDPGGEEFAEEFSGTSALESTTVWFRWEEDEEEYSARFDEEVEDPDEELLEDLDAVADLSWFLPEGEVSEGDRWDIDIAAFRRVSALSGDVKLILEGDEEDDDFDEQFEENLDGEIEGELTGFRTVDDRRVAVIHVRSELTTRVEQETALESDEVEGTGTVTFEFGLEMEGDLIWDVEAGRASRFHFAGALEMNVLDIEEYTGGEFEVVIRNEQEFEGTIAYEVEVD